MSSSVATQSHSSRKPWIVVLGATLCMIAASVPLSGLSFFHPYLFSVMGEGGATQAQILLYITLEMFAIVASMILIGGPLLPRIGATRLMLGGSVIVAISLAIFAQATTPTVLYAGGILLGLGYGASYQLVPMVWVNNWFKAKKGLVVGIVTGGTGIGGVLWAQVVPAISGLPAPDNFDYRLAYYVLAVVVLALTFPAVLFLARPETPEEMGLLPYGAEPLAEEEKADTRPPKPEPGLTRAEALKSPWMWLVLVAGVLIGVLHGSAQILTQFLTDRVTSEPPVGLGQPLTYFSLLMTLWTLGLIILKPTLGWLNDKIGVIAAMAIALGMQALFLYNLPKFADYGTVVPIVMMFFMAAGMSTGTVQPPLLTSEACGRKEYSKIWTITGTSYTLGIAVGSPIWGLFFDPATGSYPVAFAGSPLLVALIVLLGWLGILGGKNAYKKKYPAELAEWEAKHGNG